MAYEATMTDEQRLAMHRRLVESLYGEAMLLAEEARAYFGQDGRMERDVLGPEARVHFACESLKVTTRLAHVIAWLLTQRAVEAGEITPGDALHPSRRLGDAPGSAEETVASLPFHARTLAAASIALHRRTAAHDAALAAEAAVDSPARAMQDRLAATF